MVAVTDAVALEGFVMRIRASAPLTVVTRGNQAIRSSDVEPALKDVNVPDC